MYVDVFNKLSAYIKTDSTHYNTLDTRTILNVNTIMNSTELSHPTPATLPLVSGPATLPVVGGPHVFDKIVKHENNWSVCNGLGVCILIASGAAIGKAVGLFGGGGETDVHNIIQIDESKWNVCSTSTNDATCEIITVTPEVNKQLQQLKQGNNMGGRRSRNKSRRCRNKSKRCRNKSKRCRNKSRRCRNKR
jgi:hypothetical protein